MAHAVAAGHHLSACSYDEPAQSLWLWPSAVSVPADESVGARLHHRVAATRSRILAGHDLSGGLGDVPFVAGLCRQTRTAVSTAVDPSVHHRRVSGKQAPPAGRL